MCCINSKRRLASILRYCKWKSIVSFCSPLSVRAAEDAGRQAACRWREQELRLDRPEDSATDELQDGRRTLESQDSG